MCNIANEPTEILKTCNVMKIKDKLVSAILHCRQLQLLLVMIHSLGVFNFILLTFKKLYTQILFILKKYWKKKILFTDIRIKV